MKAWPFLLMACLGTCASTDIANATTDTPYTGATDPTVTTPASVPSDIPPPPVTATNTTPTIVAPSSASDEAALTVADLQEFADLSPAVQALITHALDLSLLHLKYQYGSDDPKSGGMDCSGTVHYLLEQAGLKDVPRDSGEFYRWVWKRGHVEPVVSSSPDTFELDRLKPGDLLFWTGTYDIKRDPPITHVMIYLGTNRRTGHRVMVGASEGRTFNGKARYGVGIFDFKVEGPMRRSTDASAREPQARFIGYGSIPGL